MKRSRITQECFKLSVWFSFKRKRDLRGDGCGSHREVCVAAVEEAHHPGSGKRGGGGGEVQLQLAQSHQRWGGTVCKASWAVRWIATFWKEGGNSVRCLVQTHSKYSLLLCFRSVSMTLLFSSLNEVVIYSVTVLVASCYLKTDQAVSLIWSIFVRGVIEWIIWNC